MAFAVSKALVRAISRFLSNDSPFGTNSCSKPFVVITSGLRPRKCLHSRAVMPLTVVNESATCAAVDSSECLLFTWKSLAVCSGWYCSRFAYNGKPLPAIERPSTVACVVKTVPIWGALWFKYNTPDPVIHSWKWATTLLDCSR